MLTISYEHGARGIGFDNNMGFKPGLTDAQWQKQFNLMRREVVPAHSSKIHRTTEKDSDKADIYYRVWVNDILEQLRNGLHEYCYFPHQVREILRFEPRKLRSRYFAKDGYVEIWLERGRH